ncbi:MAG: LD-carboxypeptidase [Bacteroidales bacterium]|jgi:muramoyltetrapeptide carboxypeptidase|nr:LD-carboxypeptidase [Bacteroidales bacterium]
MELLQSGDVIRIVAPARKIAREELACSVRYLQQKGFHVEFGNHLFGEFHQYAGTDEQRAEDFQQALDSRQVKALWCARGGYGSLRMLDLIDFSAFAQNPKWICGYSDITVFHAHIHTAFHLPTLHATMPINIQGEDIHYKALDTMLSALRHGEVAYSFPAEAINRKGKAEGVLCGGNLSVLFALNGSVSDIQTDGKILFIEDLDEYLYHIDRMMMCLKRSGKLAKLAALIVGGMTKMNDNTIAFGKTAEEIIMEHVSEYEYPVCFRFPAGHIPDNNALIMGGYAVLDASSNNVNITIKA